MALIPAVRTLISKSARSLGLARRSSLDEALRRAAGERLEREQVIRQCLLEREQVTRQCLLEQTERIRVSEAHAIEQQARIRLTELFEIERKERQRAAERLGLELTKSEEANIYLRVERSERLRVIKNYLDLMENCLTGSIYEDPPMKIWDASREYSSQTREYGWDWPSKAHTMIGRKRLSNFRILIESAMMHGVSGDIVETGVWRGGACILARAVLHAYADTSRTVWLADSFQGLPPPKADLYPQDRSDTFHEYEELAVGVDVVRGNFAKYGLLDAQVKFIVGWFDETLPNCEVREIAVLRLDGDMYESTIVALNNLYSKVSSGGYVIVDDYHVVEGCRLAIHDFLDREKLAPTLIEIDGVGIYWQKSS